MVIKSEFGIYRVLEKLLKETDVPLTCVDLFEKAEVRKYAADANKVSDYLGHMWRRGLLQRYHAAKTSTSLARYAYTWKTAQDESDEAVPIAVPKGAHPRVEITQEGDVLVLKHGKLVITVRYR